MKRIYMAIISILCSIGIAIAISHAWFVNGYDVDPLAKGQAADAYYYSGTGTQGDPYIITTPRHLYNLAWLQYLGTYNKPVDNNSSTYKDFYFKLGKDIDCTGWKLPPIGTSVNPFISSFDGDGHTISNLNTTNDFFDFDRHPDIVTSSNFNGCNTIGFFGSVGAFDTTAVSGNYATGANTTANSPVVNDNEIKKFYLKGCTVKTSVSTTLIGAVAGYVNATVSDVGLVTPHLNITANSPTATSISSRGSNPANISDFAVVGYAEKEYTTQKTKFDTVVYNPTISYDHFNFQGMGSGNDWGGSLNFANTYQRIYNIVKSVDNSTNKYTSATALNNGDGYIGQEIQYYKIENGNSVIDTARTSTEWTATSFRNFASTTPTTGVKYVDYGNENGSYLRTCNTDDSDQFMVLTALYKDVIIVTKRGTESGYSLNSNGKYLNISSSKSSTPLKFNVTVTSDPDEYTIWVEEQNSPGYNLYTYNPDDGEKYYLIANSDLSLSVSTTPSTIWKYDNIGDNHSYYTDINGSNYYLKYFAGEWTLKNTYVISDGNGHYIQYDANQTSKISTANTLSDATTFIFSNDGTNPSGTIRTVSGDYLRNNAGTLQIGSTDSYNSWNNSDGQLYNSYNSNTYYIQYDNTNQWHLETPGNTYYIVYNGNYLYLDSSGQIVTSGTTNKNSATVFTFTNSNGSGKASAIINNQTYYLRSNNNALTTTTSNNNATTWNRDEYGIYYNGYYIQFVNNIWRLAQKLPDHYYYISYNGYYLNATQSVVSGSTTATTKWYVDSDNYIYTIISETNYYLYASSNDTGAVSTNKTNPGGYGTVKKSGDSIYETSYTNYKLYWNGSTWKYSNSSNYTLVWDILEQDTPFGSLVSGNINSLVITKKNESTITTSTGDVTIYTNSDDDYTGDNALPALYSSIPITTKGDKVAKPSNIDYSTGTYYEVDESNTGYIISGGHETRQAADVRVSKWQIAGNNFGYNSAIPSNLISGSYSSNTLGNIYTVKTTGTAVKINESENNGVKTNDCNFTKYFAAKTTLQNTLKNQTYLYAAHFMNAPISKKRYIITTISVNGTKKENYQMPEDCIDFNLKSKGSINFFSSYFYSNTSDGGANNCFFSLNEIIRDDNGNISQIRHIQYVYERKSDHQYVYYYNDPDGSATGYYYRDSKGVLQNVTTNPTLGVSDSNYTLLFDANWIEDPANSGVSGKRSSFFSTNKQRIFYFEIPVCMGEFALGSVSKRDASNNVYNGAYLMYLDIGANAAVVDRTIITEQSVTTTQKLTYVNGIQILGTQTNDGVVSIIPFSSDTNSAVAIIPSGSKGNYNFSRTADTITVFTTTGNTTNPLSLNSTYYDETLTCNTLTLTVPHNSIATKVLKYIDAKNENLYYITVKDVGGVSSWVCNEVDKDTLVIGDEISSSSLTAEQIQSKDYGLLKKGTSGDNIGYGIVYSSDNSLTASLAIAANEFNDDDVLAAYHFYTLYENSSNEVVTCTHDFDFVIAKVTGTKTINGYNINNGQLEINGDGYSLTNVFETTGITATMSIANVPTGENDPTTTTIIVDSRDNSYTFTINGITIAVGNYTYTFSTNAIAVS